MRKNTNPEAGAVYCPQRAVTADYPGICALLHAEGLPTEDVSPESLEHFLVVREDGAVVGAVGLEPDPPYALLRSLVVHDGYRERGYGAELLTAAEGLAAALGVRDLYLLTTTAPAFFRKYDYQEVPRDEVPNVIRRSTEFQELCPTNAMSLWKRLAVRGVQGTGDYY